MPPLQPRNGAPRLQLLPGLPQTSPNRYDAVLLLIPEKSRPGRGLPDITRWQTLHRRGATDHGTVRTTTLDNSRQTLAVLGYCRKDADAFEQLRVAGLLAQRALLERPRPRRIAVIVQNAGAERNAWQESLYAALAAHCFQMPSAKHSTEGPPPVPAIDIVGASKLDLRRAVSTAEATNLVRHLTALPPNVLDATGYRRLLGALSRRHGLKLRWYNETALEKLGAGAFLAVSRGNARRDAGIAHLSYRPARRRMRDKRTDVALVGKGILFDTGGTNLKTHRSMLDMHTDMSGSAVALATIVGLAKLKAPLAVDAWLAISENSIGPAAYRPQEMVRALNGTTIQVIHSDAEGRMVLADTLALAARGKPRMLLDFATLTGACVHALTERMSGLLSNNEVLAAAALAAGTHSGERLWRFPMPEDFDTDIESQVADVAQCALEGKGDHILAARFLQRFVPKGMPWAHVDLSSSTRRGGLAQVPTEITGFGARFALSLLLDGKLPQ
jgi:leucyl aminopeptidase